MRTPLLIACCLVSLGVVAQEVCDNALDDDGDGLIDLNDTTDCICTGSFSGGEVQSIMPNPSFEQFDCVPIGAGELNCATTWQQATVATSDYFLGGGYMPAIVPLPIPDGDACVGGFMLRDLLGPGGDYLEYIGACLPQPLLAGVEYTLQFWVAARQVDVTLEAFNSIFVGPVDVTLFGLQNCVPFPVQTNLECPSSWTVLGSVSHQPDGEWHQVQISFTPATDIHTIMIGAPCVLPADYSIGFDASTDLPYFFYDDLTLEESSLFGATLTQSGGFCTNDLVLHGNPDSLAADLQWYLDGVALLGETDSILSISALGLSPGLYQFRATVQDTACAVSELLVEPPVFPQPLVGAEPTSGCAPLEVTFTNNTGAALVAEQEWDFGIAGATSTAADPVFTYNQPGLYDVTLTVTGPDGCVGDTTYTGLIEVFAPPMASFTASITTGCTGLQVQFTNTSATPGACSWSFGDAGTSTDCDALHTYSTEGLFDVTLTVTTAEGCSADTTITDLIDVYGSPVVSFTSDTVAGCVPLTITFTNTTTPSQVGSQVWDLGNGEISTDGVVTVVYDSVGTYDVSLQVTAPQGCAGALDIPDYITVHGRPQVALVSVPDSGCAPLVVAFADLTEPQFTGSCAWDLGDGATGGVCDPVHLYTEPGTYTAALHVVSPQQCASDTAYTTIEVFAPPEADFTFSPQPTDVFRTEIVFADRSSNDVVGWEWTFAGQAEPASSQVPDPVVVFPGDGPGLYAVELVVSTSQGCVDTARSVVEIDGYYSVYVPNAFSPDGDGINELFLPVVRDQVEERYALIIFDRWGQVVWTSGPDGQGWDGQQDGQPVKSGVYLWKLQTRDAVQGVNRAYVGHVTLLR